MNRKAETTAERGEVQLLRAWMMLAVLSAMFVVSMVDRFALGLLVEPLKQDLGVSDVQVGFLFGSAFAVFYGIITLPLARWADRGNRVQLILFAVVLWSTCTVLSGFATSFVILIGLRIGLAIGEGALAPSVFSLIGDLLPQNRRTLGAAIFNAFGMAGASGAYIIGSACISFTSALQNDGHFVDLKIWQAVFIIVGLPGLLLALIFAAVGREPARTRTDNDIEAASAGDVLRFVRGHGWLYPGLFLGAGLSLLGTNGFLAWTPTYLSRAFGLSIVEAGQIYGVANLLAFVGGSLIVPLVGIWVGRYRSDGIVLIAVTCAVLSSIFCISAVFQSSPSAFLVCACMGLFCAIGGASNVVSSVHMLTPPRMRATLTAAMLICLTTVALGVAPPLVGALSGQFSTEKNALGVGLGMVSALGGSISILLLFLARKRILQYLPVSQRGPNGIASSSRKERDRAGPGKCGEQGVTI